MYVTDCATDPFCSFDKVSHLDGSVNYFDKHFGRSLLTPDSIGSRGFSAFFSALGAAARSTVASALRGELLRLQRWFETQRYFRFIASSLLLLYDAHALPSAPASQSPSPSQSSPRALMIDFAHVECGTGELDLGYLTGLRSLIAHLSAVADCAITSPRLSPAASETPSEESSAPPN